MRFSVGRKPPTSTSSALVLACGPAACITNVEPFVRFERVGERLANECDPTCCQQTEGLNQRDSFQTLWADLIFDSLDRLQWRYKHGRLCTV
jgi:hypothetical protein